VVVCRSDWSRRAADLPRSLRAYERQLRPRFLDSDGRWSSQRPSPHVTSDEPLQIRPIGGLDTPVSKSARPLGAGLSRPRGQRDFAPPKGKLEHSGHIRTQSAPGILGLSGLSEGFKSLLLLFVSGRFRTLLNADSPGCSWVACDAADCVGSVPWARLERVGDHHPLDQKTLGSLGFFVADW
jgi:hypothetical protein